MNLHGILWTLRVTPSAQTLAASRSTLPFFVLVMGLLTALLIGSLIYYAWRAREAHRHISKEVARRIESEARFRATSDASPLGIFVTSPDGDCLYTNTAYQHITGLDLEATLGQGWVNAIHPDDRDRVFMAWYATAQNDLPYDVEMRYQQPDGTLGHAQELLLHNRRGLHLIRAEKWSAYCCVFP